MDAAVPRRIGATMGCWDGRAPGAGGSGAGATGDDAVQVDVDAKLLIPRVEDGQETQLPAQMMARIGAEGEERVGDRLEEDPIETRRVREDERVEIVGHGEDGVNVVDGQHLRPSRLKPRRLCRRLARGAVAMAAGVVGVPVQFREQARGQDGGAVRALEPHDLAEATRRSP